MEKPTAPSPNPPADACPRCGQPVHCGAATGRCWCADFPPLLSVPSPGQRCYCRNCLSQILAEVQAGADERTSSSPER